MPETRDIVSYNPDRTRAVVFRQRRLADDSWHNASSRPATPNEMKTGKPDSPNTEPEAPAKTAAPISGSHNTHARLAPSGSKQWTHCTPSIAYAEANKHRVKKDDGSKWSNEGTIAHDHAADILTGKKALLDIPPEFTRHVGEYCTHCMELTPEGVEPMVEVVVPLFYQPDSTGTCDFAIVTDEKVIIRDLKYGAGVLVRSEENTQLAIYTMSLIRHLDAVYGFKPDTVIDLAVYQPRHRDGADQPPWVITLAELEKFCEDISARAKEATAGYKVVAGIKWDGHVTCEAIENAAPMTKFDPSEGDDGACRWCKAKAFCERRLEGITSDIPTVDPHDLLTAMPDLSKDEKKEEVKTRLLTRDTCVDDDFLVAVYAASKALKSYLSDVEEYLQGRVLNGEAVPGTKVVMGGKGNRAWADAEEAETFLKGQKLKQDERFTFKLKSPAQIEKVLKDKLDKSTRTKNRFEKLITRAPGKRTMVLESDKRDAVPSAVECMPDEDFEI